LTGQETYDLCNVPAAVASASNVHATAIKPNGKKVEFELKPRIDTPQEAEYYRNGGILPYVLRQLIAANTAAA
jgi:aconitate hydratase